MKLKSKLRLLSLLFFAVAFSFSSCEKEDHYFDEGYIEYIFQGHYYDADKTWRLCTRSWYRESYDRPGNHYEEIITFYKEREGIVEYYKNGFSDGYQRFRWNWDNLGQTRIYVDYGYGEYSIFRDVRVGVYELSGYMNGQELYYEAM